ncbi:MAG: LamG domain-containing protein [Candidatus Kapabacteria bacterium]|nr:LamG domain-containing protein [Candidatus Kapabacteria bacterium]
MRSTVMLSLIVGIMTATGAIAQLPTYVPQNGLVAYHDFNGSFADKSSTKNRFINYGVELEKGTFNGKEIMSARFNGAPLAAKYLEAETPSIFRSNTYSYLVRFKVNEYRPLNNGGVNFYYQALLAFCPPSWKWGAAYSLGLNQLDNSALNASHWTPSKAYYANTQYKSVWLDKWYTAVVTYDATTLRIYFEGRLVKEQPASLDYSNQVAFIIGGAKDGPDGKVMGGFSGNIDDFAFWNRALRDDEVERLTRGQMGSTYECKELKTVESFELDATTESTRLVSLKANTVYKITGSGSWTPNGGYSKVDCEWEYLDSCFVRNPGGGLQMGFDLSKIEQSLETLQPVETTINCVDHTYTYYVVGTGKPLYVIFRDQPSSDNRGSLKIHIQECRTCGVAQPSDSILGYRKVETHQVVTYALRNNPAMSYKWLATGGYVLGSTTNHYCDVIWGYDKSGSVCCIVSDSTCTDTICVTTTISEKNTVDVSDDGTEVRLVVRPNPASDVIEIESSKSTSGSIYELIDVTGRFILSAEGHSARMSLVGIADGVYHVVHRNLTGQVVGIERVVVRR